MFLLIGIAQLLLFVSAENFRKEGEFVVGAILPLTGPENGVKCKKANPEGIAQAEAITFAVSLIDSPTLTVGYDILDSCGDNVIERKHANNMAREAIEYARNETSVRPVNVVMSAFGRRSIDVMNYLSIEGIPQVSYSEGNVRLTKDASISDAEILHLISAYPESAQKIRAILALIDAFSFQHVYAVASRDYEGESGLALLKANLAPIGACKSPDLYLTSSNAKSITDEITANKKIRVVVIHAKEDDELLLYDALQKANATDIIILTTSDWSQKTDLLKIYKDLVEGMIYIAYPKEKKFREYMGSLERFKMSDKPWLKKLFAEECVTKPLSTSQSCTDREKEVRKLLESLSEEAIYSVEGVYAAVMAYKKAGSQAGLLSAVKSIQFGIPRLDDKGHLYKVAFTNRMTSLRSVFELYNVRGDLEMNMVGSWSNDSKLRISKAEIRWKNGSKVTPTSACSNSCIPGYRRVFLDECCWECVQCGNGTASLVHNADTCSQCPPGEVATPTHSGCKEYKLHYFSWSSGMGSLLIFLMVLGCSLLLFATGIFTNNRRHELVKMCGYKLLMFYLLGCLLLFLAPVPLLLKPTTTACSAYISVFNLGLTTIFSMLLSRSAYINNFYDNAGEVMKSGCSDSPRVVTIVIVLLIQALILLIGLNMEPPLTLHNETSVWNVRWFECSSWYSYVWWVAFGYNLSLSVISNFFSCSSTKMNDNCDELKHVLITYCVFYLVALAEVIVFYQHVDRELTEGQAIMATVFGFSLYLTFIAPKIFNILFRTEKDGRTLLDRTLLEQEDHMAHTAIHSSDPYKHHGIVQVKIKD